MLWYASLILSISAVSVVLLDHPSQKFRFYSETACHPDLRLEASGCNFKVYNFPFLFAFRVGPANCFV
jgi:hypothetical protein